MRGIRCRGSNDGGRTRTRQQQAGALPCQIARLSGAPRLDGRTIRQLLGRRARKTPGISPAEPGCAEGLPTSRRLAGPRRFRTRSDESRRRSVRHTSACTPTGEARRSPGHEPWAVKVTRSTCPKSKKSHMLSSANNRSLRMTARTTPRWGSCRGRQVPPDRRQILATNGHLCVHTIGSFSLLGLGHSFHVPQPGITRMRTEKPAPLSPKHAAAQLDNHRCKSTHRLTLRAQRSRRITQGPEGLHDLIRWLGVLQGRRTAVRDVERNSVLKESYDQKETGYLKKKFKHSERG